MSRLSRSSRFSRSFERTHEPSAFETRCPPEAAQRLRYLSLSLLSEHQGCQSSSRVWGSQQCKPSKGIHTNRSRNCEECEFPKNIGKDYVSSSLTFTIAKILSKLAITLSELWSRMLRTRDYRISDPEILSYHWLVFVLIERIPAYRHHHLVSWSIVYARPAVVHASLDIFRQIFHNIDSIVCCNIF